MKKHKGDIWEDWGKINKVSKIRYNNKQWSKTVTFLPSSSFKAECRLLLLMLKENMVAMA